MDQEIMSLHGLEQVLDNIYKQGSSSTSYDKKNKQYYERKSVLLTTI